jgi:UDP-N-acetylmuramoyl-L-alanyl-D-glutamate--2,6-diaminopimelate ligase
MISTKRIIQKLKNTFWHLPKGFYYDYKYYHPSRHLTLIGITGTDGKTTTSTLIHQILQKAGFNTGLITTNGAYFGDQIVDTGLHMTSPDSSLTQKILADMVKNGITHAVIEITAHALDQYRYFGCHFKVAALTNITHEHLNDFINLPEYTKVKSKLFLDSDIAVLNKDDPSFTYISSLLSKNKIVSYSIDKKSNFQAKDIVSHKTLLKFKVNQLSVSTDSNYRYQIYNILAALGVITSLNIDPKFLLDTVANFPAIKGRREEVENNLKIRTIIDFAHTPAALESTLSSLKTQTKGKLIVIFGATGGRDQTKRPQMGKVVSQIANIAYVTADDTRSEDVTKINQQIISGMDLTNPNFRYFDVPNRQEAFNQAIAQAKAGDTIVACGKGHETTILLGDVEYPWSEAEAFRTAIRIRQS